MFVLLGDPFDSWCEAVQSGLLDAGREAHIVRSPFRPPQRLSWHLDSYTSHSELRLPDEISVTDREIEGVLICGAPAADVSGWSRDDAEYMQTETMAGLIAWLWSLECPVVNRYPPFVWYRPQPPLLAWQHLLRRAGLAIPDTLLTTNDADARAFGQEHGAVYAPLMSETRYLVYSEEDWDGLRSMRHHAPVCLARPHGEPELACVVGEVVIWDREPTPEAVALESRLSQFAGSAGLTWVTVALAPTADGMRVVMVDPRPRFAAFQQETSRKISSCLVQLLLDAPVLSSR